MAEGSRRTAGLIGYALVSLLGVAAGLALVQFLAGEDDEVPVATTASTVTSTTSTTISTPVEEIAIELAGVVTPDDALDVVNRAPAAPAPGVSVSIEGSAGIGEVLGSTAFLATSPDFAELRAPFLPAPDGSAARLPSGGKVVVMIALAKEITALEGLVAAVVYEEPGKTAESIGPFAGTTSALAARFGRNDVVGSMVNIDTTFSETAPLGSMRIDGPLLTFVFEPIAPFRIVFARGFDGSLDNFGINPVQAGPALAPSQLTQLGDVDAFVSDLSSG